MLIDTHAERFVWMQTYSNVIENRFQHHEI